MVEKGNLDNELHRYISLGHGLKELKAAITSIDLEKYPFIKKECYFEYIFLFR